MSIPALILLTLLCFTTFPRSVSAEEVESDPSYPIDVTARTLADPAELSRLETPGDVFLTEGFESPDALERFINLREHERGAQTITTDAAVLHSGNGALRLETLDSDGKASDAGVSLWFGPGHDTLYFRTWIRFAEDYDQGRGNHVAGTLWGWGGDDPSGGMGNAGKRPDGTDRFSAGFEPSKERGKYDPPGAMGLYTYLEGHATKRRWEVLGKSLFSARGGARRPQARRLARPRAYDRLQHHRPNGW